MPQQVPIPSVSETQLTNLGKGEADHPAESSENKFLGDDMRIENKPSINKNVDDTVDSNANLSSNDLALGNSNDTSTKMPKESTNGGGTDDHSTELSSLTSTSTIPTSLKNLTVSATPSSSLRPSTKLNGLKNRIIQRPPPLILDKVSNFHDNETNSNFTQTTQTNTTALESFNNSTNDSKYEDRMRQTKLNSLALTATKNRSDEARIIGRSSASTGVASGNSANQKFWASLNENASRNRALANARAAVNDTTYSHPNQHINDERFINRNPTKDLTDSSDTLGADLVIKHRNSNGNISTSRVVSTLSTRKKEQSTDVNGSLPSHIEGSQNRKQPRVKNLHYHQRNSSNALHRSQDILSSLGDQDDGTAHSEHGEGGNLIGVDNSTPPATSVLLPNSIDEAPPSASSSRPRSNNPFLDNDDEDDGFVSDSRAVSRKQQVSNFHKRPGSFIAATSTDKATRSIGLFSDSTNSAQQRQQRSVEEQFNELSLSYHQEQNSCSQQASANAINCASEIDNGSIYVGQHATQNANLESIYQSNGNMFEPIHRRSMHDMNNSVLYGTASTRNKVPEQSISLDSESTILQPPPSATMQLPYWMDAIYELNNAILEVNSIAGGAENGQFIYIAESGDIVLELDRIKVSGFTSLEFNELVESKQFHLLKAVQTKHSYGLTHDLKYYLNQSFLKNSNDKDLQNLIRENIYRSTIPCTTRAPRPGEKDKVDYHFLTKDQFVQLNDRGMLLECGVYSGHYYGTLKPLCDLNFLSVQQSFNPRQSADDMRQTWDANHPAVELTSKKDINQSLLVAGNPLYENHESMKMHRQGHLLQQSTQPTTTNNFETNVRCQEQQRMQQVSIPSKEPNIVAVDSEALPPGWERVIDQTHGTYYIDHNTRRTQYERPYEVELTKGAMGFGFTLVEADNGMLLVRSIIQGGPAQMNGSIKPGDILISAVGISFAGLQHTDVARLFSTFAVGDRVRLTFARSNFALDDSIIPDEYLFSNGTNGDLAIAVNPNNYQVNHNMLSTQSPHAIVVNQEFEFINVTLRRGDQGFGFTISDSIAGQKVRKIQNNEACANLKQGDILINMNDEDITSLTHKEVVERLKNCPAGEDVRLTVKRKKRFRSKTPMAMHTAAAANGEYSLDSTPQRNCKTPSLDGLMLGRATNLNSQEFPNVVRPLFQNQPLVLQQQQQQQPLLHPLPPLPPLFPPIQQPMHPPQQSELSIPTTYSMTGLPIPETAVSVSQLPLEHQIYGALSGTQNYINTNGNMQNASMQQHLIEQPNYRAIQESLPPMPLTDQKQNNGSNSIQSREKIGLDDASNSAQASETCLPIKFHEDFNELNQFHQYSDCMHNDKLVMSQMHQPQPIYQMLPSQQTQPMEYYQPPLYSNSEMIKNELVQTPALPAKPSLNYPIPQSSYLMPNNYQDNYYANTDTTMPRQQAFPVYNHDPMIMMQPLSHGHMHTIQEEQDDYEYHQVELIRESTDSNWGIRLIGGAEVDRAISIGSIVFGGAASKNGQLKSGDEIISINGIHVVGATHQHVVELISTCTNRASLVVRRKKFAEACDVVLTRKMDEGFGFVIISSGNCPLIGRIIEGSPADRCKQLHVRDRIIAVNGHYISPNMRHWQIVSMIKECGSTLRLRIIPVDCYTVELIKNAHNDNFGFSIRGGSEYEGTPLYILRVAPNGLALDLLNVGDQILEINNIPTVGMTHQQAATIIKYSDPIVRLKLRRNYVTPASLLVDSPRALQKFNQVTAEMIAVNHNTTPSNIQSSNQTAVTDNADDETTTKNSSSQLAPSMEFSSTQSVPVVGTNGLQPQSSQQQLQQSASLTSEHQQADPINPQSSSPLPYGDQGLPLYAT